MYSWGFGFTATKFIKNPDNFVERNLIRIGIGLAIIPLILVLLNLVYLPIDWKLILLFSMASPAYFIFKAKTKKKKIIKEEIFKKDKTHIFIYIVLFIALVLFAVYLRGAFNYPYLEDDDPWSYSEAAKYVSVEKNLNDDANIFKFLDPYPPAYVGFMGLLHQTSHSLSWTLKFFNALIISLGLVFFYLFAKRFTGNEQTALFSTFVLSVLPSFFTHFIWAISFAIPVFFVVLYCLEKIEGEKKWIYPLTLVVSGFMLTQPSKILKVLLLLFVYLIIKGVYKKQFLKKELLGVCSGVALSGLWWFTRWRTLFLTRPKVNLLNETTFNIFSLPKIQEYLKTEIFSSTSGTATGPYTFDDFFIAKTQGGINIHVGFGIIAAILLILGIIYVLKNYKMLKDKNNYWISVVMAWFIITFLNVNSATFNLPVGFFSFRTWLLISIPASLLCALGFNFLKEIGNKIDIPTAIVISFVILGLLFTSGYPKYALNTSLWPPGGGWTSMEEVQLHSWLKTLPDDTKVFSYGGSPVIGFDKYSCVWCKDEIEFLNDIGNKSQDEIYDFLKLKDYGYLLISGKAYKHLSRTYGDEKASEILNEFFAGLSSVRYQKAYEVSGGIILKVV